MSDHHSVHSLPPTLSDLRRYAVSRSLSKPTTIGKAIAKLGLLQAGYASGRAPKDPAFRRERDAELSRTETFLGLVKQRYGMK